jgi:hypothetical protein
MVLNLPLDECIDNNHIKNQERKEKDHINNSNKRSKAKQRQKARSLEEDTSQTP